jgi:putative transcriptional regulator
VNGQIAVSTGLDVLKAVGAGEGPRETRFILGYAGWGPGQLESEMARDDWLTAPADSSLIFSDDLDAVWGKALESAGLSL